MIKFKFRNCPLIWMFSSRKANNFINRTHERSVRIVNGDNEGNFENLLEKYKEITIHHINLQVLMIEVSKKNGYDPSIMDNFFIFRKNTYNLGSFQIILNGNKKTLRYVSETISYRAPLLWANHSDEYKLANSLSKFKSKIKTWKCDTLSVGYANFSFRISVLSKYSCEAHSVKVLKFKKN